jgi:branched-chain amino acid transport system permease protein
MIGRSRMLPQSAFGWVAIAAGFSALAVLPFFVSSYHVGLATTAMIGALLALSLQLRVGGTGLVSLGHGAFYGLAAYTVFLISPEGAAKPIWMTLPLAMAAAAAASAIIGALSLRTRGFFFLMVTLAFGQMIFYVFHDTKLGGGTDGAYLAKPMLSVFGLTLAPQDLPRARRSWLTYYVALTQLVATFLVLAALLSSMFGRVLEGVRTNEHRMQALGYNTRRYQLAAFVIAGALAGAAGHMWAMHSGFVNPELVGWHKSAEPLRFILLGGLGTLAGPIVGAFAYTALDEIAGLATQRKLLIEGLVILFTVVVLRHGLTGIRLPGWARRASKSPTEEHGSAGEASPHA